MRKNTQAAFEALQNGKVYRAQSGAIRTEADSIYSYATCLLARMDNGLFVFNATKYTPTTTQQQGGLRVLMHKNNWLGATVEVHDVPRGVTATELIKIAEKQHGFKTKAS